MIVVINKRRADFFTTSIQEKAGMPALDPEELRDYGVGAQILTELGVQDMELLTNSHHTLVGLDGYGLSIVGQRPIDSGEA